MIIKKLFPRLLLLTTVTLSCLSLNSHAQDNAPQSRIISAGAGLTELFFALDAQDSLIAVDLSSKHYATQGNIPLVGYHRQLSPEGLLALQPTVLIGTDSMGPASTLEKLTSTDVKVIKVDSGNAIVNLAQRIDTVAGLTGTQAKAQVLKKQIHEKVQLLQNSPLETPPKVMFLLMHQGRSTTVAGNNTAINSVIELSGAVNPAAALMESYKSISIEGIIEMQPDYLIVTQATLDNVGGKQKLLEKMPLLASTPAGRDGNIIPVPGIALVGFGLNSIELAAQLKQSFISK